MVSGVEQYIVNLRIGRYVFTPSWVASAVTLILLPCLIGLGSWQLSRAQEKRLLMTQAEQGRQQLLELTANNEPQWSRYQHVKVFGRYDTTRQILLDNMPSTDPTQSGRPGYRVLTPLIIDGQENGAIVLVDRGWVSGISNRQQLPIIDVDTQPREVRGLLDDLPQPGVRAGDAGIKIDQWPQRLNYPKADELKLLYGERLASRIILLDADQPEGYARFWAINFGFTPERHIGYAVQWFGLALTLFTIYIVVNLKRIEPSNID